MDRRLGSQFDSKGDRSRKIDTQFHFRLTTVGIAKSGLPLLAPGKNILQKLQLAYNFHNH